MEENQEQRGLSARSGCHPTTEIAPRHSCAHSKVGLPLFADPEDPMRVNRSHLQKMEIGKSSGCCKVSLVTRIHRTAVLQEFWCASFEEAQVYENLAAHPNVVNFKEQLTRVNFVKQDGSPSHTKVDAHVLLRNGDELLVSVKYDEKARRPSYLAEVADIAAQCLPEVADAFAVMSRYHFHPAWRECARKIHFARRGWDPEADCTVLESVRHLPASFTLGQLVEAAGLENRGWRAAIRLIGDGDIYKHPLDLFESDLVCRRAA
ncbi:MULTISPECIES: hypothetical protein [Pacificibacter]|uniref:hypothetical protein n=1 Tax=Pacificibacter TaxID=1042323 RepID=UPI001C083AF2|nr:MULTISPECIES: hypothetical protein [Pacificibacter]MBU2936490.1 hypothetical protein [Pacificibacter marinus]MDO6614708.1 hypothetical protein [Pacificibacter sp. 1_MG-2023]